MKKNVCAPHLVGADETPRGMARVFSEVPTPAYIIDEARLTKNLEILARVKLEAGCKILLAQKAFSAFYFYPLLRRYLDGSAASGLYEARLGREEMGGEVHVFSAAYRDEDFDEILGFADHIVFNSFAQWRKFRERTLTAGCAAGIRVNPECSTQSTPIYDPCAPGSRLGVRASDFRQDELDGISGLHFHTLCEQGADALALTLEAFEEKFGRYLKGMRWVNFGGGHHITKDGYDLPLLISSVRRISEKYGVTVYLEPGEAIAFRAGELVTEVLDIVPGDVPSAVLDMSAACHAPDIIEMPYRPPLFGAGGSKERAHEYRLAGPTCLAGDIVGVYSFDEPLHPGDRLAFGDMAIYTMVKNNTFNGMPLPAIIAVQGEKWRVIRSFSYDDFKTRLG